MKRINNVYEKICDLDNIRLAIYNSSVRKRHRKDVKPYVDNIEQTARDVQYLLQTMTYTPSPVEKRVIFDSHKTRTIEIPHYFPDQIIHWALLQVIDKYLANSMSPNSFANVKGRGLKVAQKTIEKDIKNDIKNMKYYMKLDLVKCFENIDHSLVSKAFRLKFKDKKLLWLIDIILESTDKGIPIGFYTSQWFSNFTLAIFDKYAIHAGLGKHYYRYLDDIVVFSSNKKQLVNLFNTYCIVLENIGMQFHGPLIIYNFYKNGLDFVGIRFFKNYSIIRKRNWKYIRRCHIRVLKDHNYNIPRCRRLISYNGWMSRTYNNKYNKYVINNCKAAISSHDKSLNKR